jgi:Zn-dependent membrane protease YugP
MRGTTRWLAGAMVALLGLVGLFMSSGARDNAVYLFGLGLFAFAVLFIFSQVRQAFDAAERSERDSSNPNDHR